jgi:hypothetical protein
MSYVDYLYMFVLFVCSVLVKMKIRRCHTGNTVYTTRRLGFILAVSVSYQQLKIPAPAEYVIFPGAPGTIVQQLYVVQEGPAQHVPAVTTETVEWCAPAVLRLA